MRITCLSHPWLREEFLNREERSDPNSLKNFDSRPNHSFFGRGNPLSPVEFHSFHEKRGRLFINKSLIRGHYKVKTALNYSYRNSRGSENGLFWDKTSSQVLPYRLWNPRPVMLIEQEWGPHFCWRGRPCFFCARPCQGFFSALGLPALFCIEGLSCASVAFPRASLLQRRSVN